MNRRIIILLLTALTIASCIKNDLPKPVVDLYIASLDVEGVNGNIILDRSTYTATIPLAEETNINAVKFNSITYGAEVETNINYTADESKIVVSKDLNGRVVNMSGPEYITLSYYQSYEWKIVATQTINRIWRVDGQIGETEWDLEGHRAIVKRRQDYPVSDVKTKEVRLGPDNYDYPSKDEIPTDFDNETYSQEVSVLAPWDTKPIMWKLVIVPTLAEPEFRHVKAGANVIWVKANAIDGSEIVFKYRKKGEEQWIDTTPNWYAVDENNPYNRKESGFVKAVIRGLESGATYEVQGWANTQTDKGLSEIPSKIFEATTLSLYQMPNSDMEQWTQKGVCWYPSYSVDGLFWGTGNPGGTIVAKEENNLTFPKEKADNEDNVPSESMGKTSAYMRSKFVAGFKFAAGNLFVGHYGKTQGTNATVYFGRPLTEDIKPVALRFKTKYSRGNINYIGNPSLASKEGSKDLTKVFICLADWDEPYCVDSANPATFFDPRTAKGVLGLGYFDSDNNPELLVENTEQWHTMTIPIEYKDFDTKAKQLVVTFSCSGYGDYFTGSDTSWMYVDDIELLYDLDEQNQPK